MRGAAVDLVDDCPISIDHFVGGIGGFHLDYRLPIVGVTDVDVSDEELSIWSRPPSVGESVDDLDRTSTGASTGCHLLKPRRVVRLGSAGELGVEGPDRS